MKRLDWRDYIGTGRTWHWPDMDLHAASAPPTDDDLPDANYIALYLGLPVDVLLRHEDELRIPRLVREVQKGGGVRHWWGTLKYFRANNPILAAQAISTKHAIECWLGANGDPYAPDIIRTRVPGAR